MNDNSENPSERMALSGPASSEGGGGGSAAAPKRARKRRRYRRSTRPKAASGAQAQAASGTVEVEESVNEEVAENAEGFPPADEPENGAETEAEAGEEEGDGDNEALPGASQENPEGSAPGAAAPGAVHKKRRHRGGRRHRRRRPDGQGVQPAGVLPPAPAPAEPVSASAPEILPVAAAPQPKPRPLPVVTVVPTPEKPERSAAPLTRVETGAPLSLKIPGLDASRAKKALVEFLQEQREIRGRARAMMELSGELNSITTSALLAEALGGDQVELYFFLDGEPENQVRREQARMVASRLGRSLEFKDLRPILAAVYTGEAGVDPERRAERIIFEKQAWLLDLAEAHNAMVVQSTNKTERLLTRSAGQVGEGRTVFPLGDVYQSQVVDLARACNIPAEVVNPTRDFPLAQELGLKTAEIDGLLYQMLDVKISLARLMDLGLPEGKVHALYQKLRAAAQVRRSSAWEPMAAFYVPRPWASNGTRQ
jgi:NAD+ synthase